MKFNCPHCEAELELPDEDLDSFDGQAIQCPACEETLDINFAEEPEPEPEVKQPPKKKVVYKKRTVPSSKPANSSSNQSSNHDNKRKQGKQQINSPTKSPAPLIFAGILAVVAIAGGIGYFVGKDNSTGDITPPEFVVDIDIEPDAKDYPSKPPDTAPDKDTELYQQTLSNVERCKTFEERLDAYLVYMNTYPKGKYIQQINKAAAKDLENSTATVEVESHISFNYGRKVPTKGWIQFLSTSCSIESIEQAIASDEAVVRSFRQWEQAKDLNRRAAELGSEGSDIDETWAGEFYREKGSVIARTLKAANARVVKEGMLENGVIVFKYLPEGRYVYYGSGSAGNNGVGFIGEVVVKKGKYYTLSPNMHHYFDSSGALNSWKTIGDGKNIQGTEAYRNLRTEQNRKMERAMQNAVRERQSAEQGLRNSLQSEGYNSNISNDPDAMNDLLKRRVEAMGLEW